MDRLRPYFPPLLDTSDIAEQLTPIELNPDCMEQATTDCIMDMHIKNTHQQRSNYIGLSNLANSCTKESGSPGTKFSKNFLISWRNLTQWGPLLPKGGGMIQVDIGGHPPIPLGPPPLSLSVFQFRHNLLFLAVFRVLNFQIRFEALNDVFWVRKRQRIF